VTIDVVIVIVHWEGALPSFYIQGVRVIRKVRIGYNSSHSMTLSLFFSNYKI
jgi:hypothetical protein